MSAFQAIGVGAVVPRRQMPTAMAVASPEFGVIGSVVKLDGRASTDPDGLPLTYSWSFVAVPIGSLAAADGFKNIDEDSGLVAFSPDYVGEYTVKLTISNGVFSAETTVRVSIRAIMVPDGRGLVPDGKFIWSFIRDVWQQVESKEVFETFWSALIQICGAELLKLYQIDFNKSIRDIQDLFQRRWLKYEPRLSLDAASCSFFLGGQLAGTGGSTGPLGQFGKALIMGPNDVTVVQGTVVPDVSGRLEVLYSKNQENVGKYLLSGVNPTNTGYRLSEPITEPNADRLNPILFEFTFRSPVWRLGLAAKTDYAKLMGQFPTPIDELTTLFSSGLGSASGMDIRVGDYIQYPRGVNAGLYRIMTVAGAFVTVDPPPPSASEPEVRCYVYRPVAYKVSPPTKSVTNLFMVPHGEDSDFSGVAPGRLITVGGQAFTIVNAQADTRQASPLNLITTAESKVVPWQDSLNWRLPHTLVSKTQNFEELGVSSGDLLFIDVVDESSGATSSVRCQVVGVSGYRLGFVVSDEPLKAGEVPSIPASAIVSLANDLGLSSAALDHYGALQVAGDVKAILDLIGSVAFHRIYWNRELSSDKDIRVLGAVFHLQPRLIVRNRRIPTDSSLKSVPVLQEWITQPKTVERDGKIFQVKGDKEYELKNSPVVLVENNDYVIDGEVAYQGEMSFRTGSSIIASDGMDFIDRGVMPGDTLTIHSPITLAADYHISAVLAKDRVVVSPPVPTYQQGVATSNVTVKRRSGGTFLRIIPGAFTAGNPLPERLWAEVSYFDNNEAVESNFGILVGLRRQDLESLTTDINYRQAVAGLMFAYTRGSTVNKLRLGAQILLGLPFAEHRGVVRSVEDDYRLDSTGKPVMGRILIEDVSVDGYALGTLRVYTYPIDPVSDLAGVETNPKTGKPYEVAQEPPAGKPFESKDIVEIFAALSKGVEVVDYLSKPLDLSVTPARNVLKQFHSFRLRANDNIFTLAELNLVSDFLRKITPSYVAFVIMSASEFSDSVSLGETVYLTVGNKSAAMADNPSLGLSTALIFDQTNFSGRAGIFWDEGVFYILRSGADLTTTLHVPTLTVPSGGLVTPRFGEGPVAVPGDVLAILSGSYVGHYVIDTVADTELTLVDGPQFLGESSLQYALLRPVRAKLRTDSGTSSNGTMKNPDGEDVAVGLVAASGGLVRDGVSPGDLLLFDDGSQVARHTVVGLVSHLVSGKTTWDTVAVIPTFSSPGSGTFRVYRTSLMEAPYQGESGHLSSNGVSYTLLDNAFLKALMETRDELMVEGQDVPRLFVNDPATLNIQPVLPSGTYLVRLCKPGHVSTPIGFGTLERQVPEDSVTLTLH